MPSFYCIQYIHIHIHIRCIGCKVPQCTQNQKKRRSKREVGERRHPSAIVQEETEQNRNTQRAAGGGGGRARGVCCVCVYENTLYESLKKGQQDLVSRDAFCSPNKKVISSDIHSSIHSRCNDSTIHYYKNMLDFFLPRLNRFFFPFSSWL